MNKLKSKINTTALSKYVGVMALTSKQESFAQNLASGMTQADAYRAAYSASKMKDSTVQESASRLMADRKVSARVAGLKAELAAKALWTREQSVLTLSAIAGTGANSEKISAVKELNVMHGYNAPTDINLNGKIGCITRIELVAPDAYREN